MSQTLETGHGAAKFCRPARPPSRTSEAVVFTGPEPDDVDPAWDAIIETIEAFGNLEDDWDGDQAVAPDSNLVYMAVELARQLKECLYPAPTRTVAGVNGTISFEFGGHPFPVIEVVSPRRAEVYEAGKLVNIFLTEEV